LIFRDEFNMLRRDLIGCIQDQIVTISIWEKNTFCHWDFSSDVLTSDNKMTWKQQNRKMNTNTMITVMSSQPLIQRSWDVQLLISLCEHSRSIIT
jgi:hypothetical protein